VAIGILRGRDGLSIIWIKALLIIIFLLLFISVFVCLSHRALWENLLLNTLLPDFRCTCRKYFYTICWILALIPICNKTCIVAGKATIAGFYVYSWWASFGINLKRSNNSTFRIKPQVTTLRRKS